MSQIETINKIEPVASYETRPETRTAFLLFGLIAILGGLGILGAEAVDGEAHSLFNMDRELNPATAFSSFLLLLGGVLAIRAIRRGILPSKAAGGIAFLFIFMAMDESLKIHETAEKLLKVDWQILYLPILLFAGISWVLLWFRGDRLFRWLWFAGAAAWVCSQLLEAGQWGWWWGDGDSKADSYHLLVIWEEILEMAGSALFCVALHRVLSTHNDRLAETSSSKSTVATAPLPGGSSS